MELYSLAHTVVAQSLVNSGSRHPANQETRSPSFSASEPKSPIIIGDTVDLSQEGREKAGQSEFLLGTDTTAKDKSLDQKELAQLQQLKLRDTEVRNHEQAHLSAAGQFARGGASFTYRKGPDGASYAIGGEVGIDVSKESTPEATISKMQTIKRAALWLRQIPREQTNELPPKLQPRRHKPDRNFFNSSRSCCKRKLQQTLPWKIK